MDPAAIETLASLNTSGSADLVTVVVAAFLKAIPVQLAMLNRNLVTPDLKTLSRMSHDLKSSSASIGAIALASACAELERVVRFGTTRGAVALVHRIIDEIEALRPELEALLRCRRDGSDSAFAHGTASQHEAAQ